MSNHYWPSKWSSLKLVYVIRKFYKCTKLWVLRILFLGPLVVVSGMHFGECFKNSYENFVILNTNSCFCSDHALINLNLSHEILYVCVCIYVHVCKHLCACAFVYSFCKKYGTEFKLNEVKFNSNFLFTPGDPK